ncbi:MAG: hypothetical protein JXP37_10010 [Coriobacteriia bacterium]|nr:hypothetical protein [Coriobacteriia bacterium]
MSDRPLWRVNLPYIVIALLDVFAIGLGGGVPVLAIVYGAGVGWWLVRRGPEVLPETSPASEGPSVPRAALRTLIARSAALTAVSLVVLLVVWVPSIPHAFDPAFDPASVGIPLILYTQHASMIGWLVLMLVVSPVLQFAMTVTGGAIALAVRP